MNLKDRNFESEFKFRTSRSGGAGGQHVNTTETKVELVFDIHASAILTDEEKAILFKRIDANISDKGELRVTSSASRSQAANKETAIKKFYTLLQQAFIIEKRRIATKVPAVIKEDILKNKKEQSKKKKERGFRTRDFL